MNNNAHRLFIVCKLGQDALDDEVFGEALGAERLGQPDLGHTADTDPLQRVVLAVALGSHRLRLIDERWGRGERNLLTRIFLSRRFAASSCRTTGARAHQHSRYEGSAADGDLGRHLRSESASRHQPRGVLGVAGAVRPPGTLLRTTGQALRRLPQRRLLPRQPAGPSAAAKPAQSGGASPAPTDVALLALSTDSAEPEAVTAATSRWCRWLHRHDSHIDALLNCTTTGLAIAAEALCRPGPGNQPASQTTFKRGSRKSGGPPERPILPSRPILLSARNLKPGPIHFWPCASLWPRPWDAVSA